MLVPWELVTGWVFTTGFIGFTLMGIDKARARDRGRRIPEIWFFCLAFLGGSFGIIAGGSLFHHKTLKASFMAVVLTAAAVWVAILVGLFRTLGLTV